MQSMEHGISIIIPLLYNRICTIRDMICLIKYMILLGKMM